MRRTRRDRGRQEDRCHCIVTTTISTLRTLGRMHSSVVLRLCGLVTHNAVGESGTSSGGQRK